MSKSKRTKQREQIGFMLSVIFSVVALGLLVVGDATPTRWVVFATALIIAVTFGFLRRTH